VLSKRKSLIECTPLTDILEESMDTQDVAKEPDSLPVTEIAVSVLLASEIKLSFEIRCLMLLSYPISCVDYFNIFILVIFHHTKVYMP
jgi:hypothetical protein